MAVGALSFGEDGLGVEISEYGGVIASVYAITTVDPPSPGDFNGDGVVDGDDRAQWKATLASMAIPNANGDGLSDGTDFLAWQSLRGNNVPIAAGAPVRASVPEPAAALLMTVGILLVTGCRTFLTRGNSTTQQQTSFEEHDGDLKKRVN